MEIKHIDGYDCIDDNLATIFAIYKLDIRRIFANLWYFEFDKSAPIIGEGLMNTNINKYNSLNKYFNINYYVYENTERDQNLILKDIGNHKKTKKEEILNIIQKNKNKNNIIIAEVDTYRYRYDKGYEKYKGTHSYIINKINENNLEIIDVWYKLYNAKLEYEEFIESVCRIIVLDMEKVEIKSIKKEELKNSIIDEKSIENMKEFFKRLLSIDLEKEYNGLEIEFIFKAPIDKGLRKIIMNRKRYAYYLQYISEIIKNTTLLKISDDILQVTNKFSDIRNILIQSYLLNKDMPIEKIKKLTEKIIENEINIKNRIERWI